MTSARPNQIAAADAENAQKVHDWMDRFSQEPPVGILRIPTDIFRVPGGIFSVDGGEEYEIPFQV